MISKNQLVNKITREVNSLENKIEYSNLYNIRNSIIRIFMKIGISIDYALPFILATTIMINSEKVKNNPPFHIDNITEKAKIETIDTSNGLHIEHISYDYDYKKELIEYSTGWTNNNGMYERTVTTYKINKNIDLSETDKLLAMSKEDIENILSIKKTETISKKYLTKEDEMYNEDALIIINHQESDETITREESLGENVLVSLWFIVMSLCWGNNIRLLGKIFIKTYIRDEIRQYRPLFRKITKEELLEMKKLLELKKENLALITSEKSDEVKNNSYSYVLRRW